MNISLVVGIIGKNEPGIISTVADMAASCGANWVESHLAEMVGQFAGIVHLEVPHDKAEALKQTLSELNNQGLIVTLCTAEGARLETQCHLVKLEILGQDHPGIVRDIAKALSARQVNIESLETGCSSGSMSGEQIFTAKATLSVPQTVSTEELDNILQTVSSSLMVDVVLEDAD